MNTSLVLCVTGCLLLLCCSRAAGRNLLQDDLHTLSGKAIVLNLDRKGQKPLRLLGIRTADGRRIQLQTSHSGQADGLHSGMRISVSGRWTQQQPAAPVGMASAAAAGSPSSSSGGASFVASTIRASGSAAGGAPTLVRTGGAGVASAAAAEAAAAVPAAPVVLSTNKLVASSVGTIFIPIMGVSAPGQACAGTTLPLFTTQQVRQAVFAESNPSKTTVGSTFNKCSYGKTTMTAANSMVAEPVELPCSGTTNGVSWTFDQCNFDDFNGWADAADEVLRARNIDLSKYKHKAYLLPPSACGFVGLGYVGCDGSFDCRVWMGADMWTSPQAIAHELMHNLYLAHAGSVTNTGIFDEYADQSCTMGYCCSNRCPNTPHAWQLGWISVQQLDGSSLTPGQTVTAWLNSQAASSRSGLRILPTWVAGVDPIFVGYRTKAAGDADTGADIAGVGGGKAGKVHAYTAAITNTYDPKVTTWRQTLSAAGQSWQHSQAGLVVRLTYAGGNGASVTVCRKAGAETVASCQAGRDNDCNGLAGSKDPACARLLRTAPLTTAPPPKPKLLRRPKRGMML